MDIQQWFRIMLVQDWLKMQELFEITGARMLDATMTP
jgi:hypothetical protein